MKETLKAISDAVSDSERELGLDWRTTWHRIGITGERSVRIELSRPEVGEAVSKRLAVMFPGPAPQDKAPFRTSDGIEIEQVLAGGEDGQMLWTVSSVADLRREPEHSSELLSQSIMGESMWMIERRGDWYFVMMKDGYHGWVRSWYVAEVTSGEIRAYEEAAKLRFEANVGYVLSDRSGAGVPVSDVTAGSMLLGGETEAEQIKVTLPGGKSGWLPAESVITLKPSTPTGESIVRRAERFLGIPYIWGGTSAKGFDCSGLVKRVFLMEGIELPRDADQQSTSGRPVQDGIGKEVAGDLLFFGEGGKITHVAIALGDGRFLHAFGDVRINSYREGDELYEDKLAGKLLFARSVISSGTG